MRGVRHAGPVALALLLIVPSVRAEDGITWNEAFVAGVVGRTHAVTEPLDARGSDQIELSLILEGERAGLPVYCAPSPMLRIEGRRIARRLIVSPEECGLADAETQWVTLQPSPGLADWNRHRIGTPEGGWTLAVRELPGEAPGLEAIYGTARWAAAIALPDGRRLETDGWSKRADWAHPEQAPGYAVTRAENSTLEGKLLGLARLPVTAAATPAHERARIAFTSCGLVLGAYEAMAGATLADPVTGTTETDPWSWLFFELQQEVARREPPGAACVGLRGRPVPWIKAGDPPSDGVRRGDVFRFEDDQCVMLLADDGDGWLGNGDRVLHSAPGTLARATLGDVQGRRGRILRVRDFQQLRRELTRAGYGQLGTSWMFGPELRRAVREFQRDHGLPETGAPDAATEEAVIGFLGALDAARSGVE